MLMKRLCLQIIFLSLLSSKGATQGLYDDQQLFSLFHSGKSKVKVFVNEKLKSIWHIDSLAKTIEIHTLEPMVINPVAPRYDNKLSTTNLKKYFFNKLGNIDSIVITGYQMLMSPGNPPQTDTIADTTVIIYAYPLIENWAMNRKKYLINNGKKRILSSDYFGYDSQKRLVLLIQDEGRVQFFYSYNEKGQIEKETVLGAAILYEYNYKGQMVSRVSDTQKITYAYNQDQLLMRKVILGKNPGTTIYEYE